MNCGAISQPKASTTTFFFFFLPEAAPFSCCFAMSVQLSVSVAGGDPSQLQIDDRASEGVRRQAFLANSEIWGVQTRAYFAAAILARLAHWSARARAAGFGAVLAAWQRHAGPPGAPITVRLPAGPVSGRYAGLDADGALLVALEDGRTRRIVTGEVFAGG